MGYGYTEFDFQGYLFAQLWWLVLLVVVFAGLALFIFWLLSGSELTFVDYVGVVILTFIAFSFVFGNVVLSGMEERNLHYRAMQEERNKYVATLEQTKLEVRSVTYMSDYYKVASVDKSTGEEHTIYVHDGVEELPVGGTPYILATWVPDLQDGVSAGWENVVLYLPDNLSSEGKPGIEVYTLEGGG